MTSEPSSTTIASEPSTSTSEIQTDTSEPSQLEVLALNYLRNQEISTIPTRIPKLNPCSICQRVILKFRFQSFVVLDCEHLFHRQCLEKYIMQAETEPPLTCPSCNVIIELTREEAVLASGKYHLQKKQTDTGQGDEELMALLGLVEGGSHAGQGGQSKQVTMQDQATSPIIIEDDDDNTNNNVQTQSRRNSSRQSSRQESPANRKGFRNCCKNYSRLLRENSWVPSQGLARLYRKGDYMLWMQINKKLKVGTNMLKDSKIGSGILELKIHQLPIQQLGVEHTVKSLNIFRELQKQICVRKPRKQGIYTRCLWG